MPVNAKKQAGKVLAALKKRYVTAGTQLEFSTPWELLVATVLAAQCTDARVNQITPLFFKRWPGPSELSSATVEDVENVIHSTGLFHQKAKNLVAAAKMIMEKYDGKVPASMDDLIKLPGIARKTANIVMYAGYGINAGMAVDTHVKRISGRLGLTENSLPQKIEKDLMEIFPQSEWGDLNHRMVGFGREVCSARNPKCSQCELAAICPSRRPPKETRKSGRDA